MPTVPIPIAERFADKYEQIPPSTCWWWTASLHARGYGQIYGENGKPELAHRVSYMIHKGEIPDGMFVCHTCDERLCVNPDHLWLGTNDDNVQDMVEKGRNQKGESHYNAKITDEDVQKIKSLKGLHSQSKIAKMFNVSQGYICEIINNKKRKG